MKNVYALLPSPPQDAEKRLSPSEAREVFDAEVVRQLREVGENMGVGGEEEEEEPNPWINK